MHATDSVLPEGRYAKRRTNCSKSDDAHDIIMTEVYTQHRNPRDVPTVSGTSLDSTTYDEDNSFCELVRYETDLKVLR